MYPFRTLLELRIENEPRISDSLSKFRGLARASGLDFRPIHLQGLKEGERVPEQYFEDIRSAHGYWVRWPGLLLHDEFSNKTVMRRIRSGEAWMVLHADRNYRADYEGLLKEFGIAVTDVGVFRADAASQLHPRVVGVDRDIDAGAFRDSLLFRGVKALSLSGIHGLICNGDSQAVFAVPDRDIELVDERDLFTSWPSPEIPCIAIWRSPEGRGGLVVLSCGFYRDPYTGPFGDYFPEIAGCQNEQLCINLLKLVADVPVLHFGWDEAAAALRQIESNLFQVTKSVLASLYGDWWEGGVAEAIRDKCRLRRDGEKGVLHESAYMELLDYKRIWKAQWETFRTVLAGQGINTSSKDRALGFFDRIHPIRLKVAHPTKTTAAGQHMPTSAERNDVTEVSQLVIRMYQAVIGWRANA